HRMTTALAARRRQSSVATITSDALTTAMTGAPSARPSWRTASTVIEATSRTPLASSSTLAMASPELMAMTVAGIWLRALSLMRCSSLESCLSSWRIYRNSSGINGSPDLAAVVKLELIDRRRGDLGRDGRRPVEMDPDGRAHQVNRADLSRPGVLLPSFRAVP